MKPGYKQTEVGVIPLDWDAVAVGNLARFTSGKGISVAALRPQSSDSPVPVFGGNGIAGYTDSPSISTPCVAVGRVGQRCGEVYLTDGPAWITDNALYPRKTLRDFDLRFFALALEAAGLNNVKNRNDLPLVTQSILHSQRLLWPPTVREQRVIAEALGDVDGLLGGLDRLIAKKRDLKQAAMQRLLTGQARLPGFHGEWEVKRLGDVAEMGSGGTPPSSVPAYYDGDIPWASISDMTKGGKVILSTDRNLTRAGFTNSAAQMFPAGTILYAMYASLGECSIAGISLCSSQAILGIRPKQRLSGEYLYYFLTSLRGIVKTLGQQGTQANLNKGMVQDFRLSLPSLTEQTAIAEVLMDMDLELEALEQRRDKTRALKQAMMQELLTGRTRLV